MDVEEKSSETGPQSHRRESPALCVCAGGWRVAAGGCQQVFGVWLLVIRFNAYYARSEKLQGRQYYDMDGLECCDKIWR